MPVIYRKTEKGQAEIETRAYRLVPRMRSALIMVDGRRTDEELRKLIAAQPDECLGSLIAEGFIEPAHGRVSAPVAAPVATVDLVLEPVPEAGVPSRHADPVSSLPPTVRPFEETRRLAVRLVNDALGPMAETIAVKMERSRSNDELRPLLHTARRLIGNARGGRSAEEFAARIDLRA
jgi:hypothetical protein